MKVWIERVGVNFYIHVREPEVLGSFGWYTKNSIGIELCDHGLGDIGFMDLPLPGSDDLHEYSLKGKKPKLVCIWEPV